MKMFIKYAMAATLAGSLAVAMATPSQARHGRNAALIGGFAAGAVIGAAAANNYYGPGDGYYDDGYAYAPDYAGAYAYEPAPNYYYGPRYDYNRSDRSNWGACSLSPGSVDYVPCNNP
jgi:hypothetical protein